MEENNKRYAFISYSSKNQKMADDFLQLMVDRGINCWRAPDDIPAGSKYAYIINDALEQCSCLILLLTKESQKSQYVERELDRAISYEKTIIPVRLDDVELNSGMKFYLGSSQIITVQQLDPSSKEMQHVFDGAERCLQDRMPEPPKPPLRTALGSDSPGKPKSKIKFLPIAALIAAVILGAVIGLPRILHTDNKSETLAAVSEISEVSSSDSLSSSGSAADDAKTVSAGSSGSDKTASSDTETSKKDTSAEEASREDTSSAAAKSESDVKDSVFPDKMPTDIFHVSEEKNLRSEPTYDSKLVTTVDPSDTLYYYGESEQGLGSDNQIHDWYKVYVDDQTYGWIRSDLCS